jgi:hypothetical protein
MLFNDIERALLEVDVSPEAMTVVYWTKPEKRRDGEGAWVETGGQLASRVHVSRDGGSCVCGPRSRRTP